MIKLEATSIQKRFWILSKLNPESAAYNIQYEFNLKGNLNVTLLVSALDYYVNKINSACRTNFINNDSKLFQIIRDRSDLKVKQISTTQKTEINHVRDEIFYSTFNLESDPLYRFALIKISKNHYTLLACFHHIIYDNGSETKFFETLENIYNGNKTTNIESNVSINDFIDYERQHLSATRIEAAETAWVEDFKSDSLHVNLSGNYHLKEKLSGRSFNFSLDQETTEKLRHFCSKNHTTSFRFFLSVYAALLKIYSRQNSITINYPVSLLPDKYKAIGGCFVNNMLLSIQFTNADNIYGILEQVNLHRKKIKNHKFISYDLVIESLRSRNIISNNDIANICLADSPGLLKLQSPQFEGLTTSPVPLERFEPIFDINLIYKVADEIKFQFDYDQNKFNHEFMESLSSHFKNLIKSILDNPSANITLNSLLGLTKNDEQMKLVASKNPTLIKDTLPGIFTKITKCHSTRTALCDGGTSLTYAELDQRSNQLAHLIRDQYQALYGDKLPADTLIGLCVDRSFDTVLGILGILKAGAAYVPLDPNYPIDRIQYVLEDSHASLVLTHKKICEQLPIFSSLKKEQIIILDSKDTEDALQQKSNNAPEIKIAAVDLAYVIYTSGSTGKPKGVLIQHSNVVRIFTATKSLYGFNETDVWPLFHSFAFDVSVWEIWGALLHGGKLVIVPYMISRDPNEFYRLLEDEKVTVLNQTPSAFQQLNKVALRKTSKLNHLRYVIFAGEALHIENLRGFWKKYGDQKPQLVNMYGITETTIHTTHEALKLEDLEKGRVGNIGRPISDLHIYILDESRQICPTNITGEIYVGGPGLARGYLNRRELTEERFIQNPYSPNERLYKSGDLARWLPDGSLQYLGRIDFQVKLRGFRIELGEIEHVISSYPNITQVLVVLKAEADHQYLLAYYTIKAGISEPSHSELQKYLSEKLPDYMIPSTFIKLEEFPLTSNGKIDRKQLPEPSVNKSTLQYSAESEIEKRIFNIWSELLKNNNFNCDDQFFNVGGNSFLAVQLQMKLEEEFSRDFKITDIFQYPTVRSFSAFITKQSPELSLSANLKSTLQNDIAIIGMACRVPGAQNIHQFWENLVNEVESIQDLSSKELIDNGISHSLINQENFVKRGAILKDAYSFDAKFFGYTPKEAECIDPQQRQFLECAWEALEDSGNMPDHFNGEIGVYAGQGGNDYYVNIQNNPSVFKGLGQFQAMINNDKDFLSTKASFKFNLSGPSISIQTGCSTSLVAVHIAAQQLILGECDLALAGGASIYNKYGYLYQEGMIESPDGFCRAFDEKAGGTVISSGIGVVVLKRLTDAINDNDHIYAIIKGSAINNDGANKVGYTAPSINGQAAVIDKALKRSGINPESISYIEAHGTGTALGDPIEIAALNQAFKPYVNQSNFCALGSLKSNIGHTDSAAGVLGLIKTALSLKHKTIPASLHFNKFSEDIEKINELFYVNKKTSAWKTEHNNVLRAGVSSFGIGGTNAHVILEEYNQPKHERQQSDYYLLPLSAKNETSLKNYQEKIYSYLLNNQDVSYKNISYTLQRGRKAFNTRSYLIASTKGKAATLTQCATIYNAVKQSQCVFMFPGQGSQYTNMASSLYKQEVIFKNIIDECCDFIEKKYQVNLFEIIYPTKPQNSDELNQTQYTQLALFIIEYAMAKLLISYGVTPAAMIGHSIGEYVAATIAEVFSITDALKIVAERGRLMQSMEPGKMLAVHAHSALIKDLLPNNLSLAAINAKSLCVVSGKTNEVLEFKTLLNTNNIKSTDMQTSHAFHSSMMYPLKNDYLTILDGVQKSAPKIKFISNLSGTWITENQARSSSYWVEHLLNAVQFESGINTLSLVPNTLFIEAGPGLTLATFCKQNKDINKNKVFTSIRHPKENKDDSYLFLNLLGALWANGIEINWEMINKDKNLNKISLPTYSFNHEEYRIAQPSNIKALSAKIPSSTSKNEVIKENSDLQKLKELWQLALGIETINISDNFFDLGGHSLIASQLLASINENFAIHLSMGDILENSTLSDLYALVVKKISQPIQKSFKEIII